MERTLVIVKPHAVARGLVGEFVARFERMGLQIEAARVVAEAKQVWERFYPSDEVWLANVGKKTLEDCAARGVDVKGKLGTTDALEIGKRVKQWLVDHMASAPAVAFVLTGNEAASKVRKVCGKTLPNQAEPGTIRFDYSSDSPSLANDEKRPVYNLIHASDPTEMRGEKSSIDYEIGILFPALK